MAGEPTHLATAGTRHILFDVTLTFRSIGARPDGILRAERSFARALIDRPDLSVTFCRFERRTGRLVRIARSDVEFMTRYVREGPPRRPRGPRKALRDVRELLVSPDARHYRHLRWDPGRVVRALSGSGYVDPATFAPGTVYVLAGMIFDTHDTSTVVRLKEQAGLSIFAMCYDVLPIVHPEFFQSREVVERFRQQTRLLLDCADRISSISRSARDDLAAFAREIGKAPPDLAILRLGFDIPPAPPSAKPRAAGRLAARGYVLSVGNINIRKNHVLLYRVWRRLAETRGDDLPPLVFAGRIGWRVDDLLESIRTDPLTRGRIVLINDADDAALAWLYANALFTVYPSFYEGWGLPVSESLAFGRYCLTSTTSSLPEAACGIAATLDPNDDAAWEAAVTELLDDPSRLEAHERRIADEFKPRLWADASRELVEQVLSTPHNARPAV